MEFLEKKLEIFYDHYKDTFQIQLRYIENRNRYFLIVLALIAILFFQMTYPDLAESIFRQWSQKQMSEGTQINFSFINSIFLFGLLWVLVLYYQTNLHIERQYKYIHALEETLSTHLTPFNISREGKSYLTHFPIVSWLIIRIYKFVFPLGIICAIGVKLISEWNEEQRIYFIFNSILCVLIAVITIFYIVWSQWKDFSKPKKKK